tara:strand:+ start:12596 stop:13774 length:1179 start_codon:yes stop_codon:yes gene_type:complete
LNSTILHPKVQQFISDYLHTDISKLLFKGSPFNSVSAQELATQIISKQKSEKKLPTWFKTKNIYYPAKVNIEQTSSEITAMYKSSLITGSSVIDITGGFGIDAYYFSKKINKVTHCELDANLSTIVNNNYQQLKANNIQLISGDGVAFLKSTSEKYDWIYIDPSRRDFANNKVFLLKDCLPNVPENLEFLFSKSKYILIKNSPILDISKTIEELNFVKEIHVVAVTNEVKELLFILEKDYKDNIQIKTINIHKKNNQYFDFKHINNSESNYSEPKKYIYEPNAAILKSGGFNEISVQLNIEKLHPHSHLYTSNNLIEFPGRTFLLENSCQYKKKEIKKYLTENKANITTRNFPETVAQIRKKTKIKDGGSYYLFFTTVYNGDLKVLICSQVF